MDYAELKLKTVADLDRMLGEHRSRLMALRFQMTAGQVKDVREVRELKKEIAQMETAKAALNKKTV